MLAEAVVRDVEKFEEKYTVHNDDSHGGEFDGCGFAARINEISDDLTSNIEDIIEGLRLDKKQDERARQLAGAARSLALPRYAL